MKIYKLPNGDTKEVLPEEEAAFLEQCKKDNIKPVLISEEPQGKIDNQQGEDNSIQDLNQSNIEESNKKTAGFWLDQGVVNNIDEGIAYAENNINPPNGDDDFVEYTLPEPVDKETGLPVKKDEKKPDDTFAGMPAKWQVDLLEGSGYGRGRGVVADLKKMFKFGFEPSESTYRIQKGVWKKYFPQIKVILPGGEEYELVIGGDRNGDEWEKEAWNKSIEGLNYIQSKSEEFKNDPKAGLSEIFGVRDISLLGYIGKDTYGPDELDKIENAIKGTGYEIIANTAASVGRLLSLESGAVHDIKKDGEVVLEAATASEIQAWMYNNITTEELGIINQNALNDYNKNIDQLKKNFDKEFNEINDDDLINDLHNDGSVTLSLTSALKYELSNYEDDISSSFAPGSPQDLYRNRNIVDRLGGNREDYDLIVNYLNEPITERYVAPHWGAVPIIREVDNWRREKWNNLEKVTEILKNDELSEDEKDSQIKEILGGTIKSPETIEVLKKLIDNKVGWDEETVLKTKNEQANSYANQLSQIEYKKNDLINSTEYAASQQAYGGVDAYGNEITTALPYRRKILDEKRRVYDQSIVDYNNQEGVVVENLYKEINNLNGGITFEGEGLDMTATVDFSNYIDTEYKNINKDLKARDEELGVKEKRVQELVDEINGIDNKIKELAEGNYANNEEARAAQNKINSLNLLRKTTYGSYLEAVGDHKKDSIEYNKIQKDYLKSRDAKVKELNNKYQAKVNEILKNKKTFIEQKSGEAEQLSHEMGVWLNDYSRTEATLDNVVKEYNTWQVLKSDINGSMANAWYSMGSAFGRESSLEKMEFTDKYLQKSLPMMIDYNQALEHGQKGFFIGRTFSQQSAPIVMAIGGTAVGIPTWAIAGSFGLQSGGQTRLMANNRDEIAEDAKEKQASLIKARANGSISKEDFDEKMAELENVIAINDLTQAEIEGAVALTGIIEMGTTMFFGTIQNSKTLVNKLMGKNLPLPGTAVTTKNWSHYYNALKGTGLGIASEITEEEIIYFGSTLAQGLIFGDELDFSHWDDTMLTAGIISGPMTGPVQLYSAITQHYAGNKVKLEVESIKKDQAKIDKALKGLKNNKQDNIYREQLREEYRKNLKKLAIIQGGLEVDAIVGGVDALKELSKNSINLNVLHRQAGIIENDSAATKKKKIEDHIAKLKDKGKNKEAEDFSNRLSIVEKSINNVKNKINQKLEGDLKAKNGLLERLYGKKGAEVYDRMLEKDPSFEKLSNRDKLNVINQHIKADFQKNMIEEAKPKLKKFVEKMIYGKSFKESGRKNRKRKQEKQLYENLARQWNTRKVYAKLTYRHGLKAGKKILEKYNIDLKGLELVEGKTKKEIENALQSITSLNTKQKSDALKNLLSGKTKGLIVDGKYIFTGEKSVVQKNLEQGDVLQGTVIAHEIGHALDALTMTDTEMSTYVDNLYSHMWNNKGLFNVLDETVRQLSLISYPKLDSKGKKILDENGQVVKELLWDPAKDVKDQSILGKEEFAKRVQDLLKDPSNKKALEEARKSAGTSLGNIFRGTKLGAKVLGGDFKLETGKDAMNYMVSFIDSFEKSDLSDLVKRRMKARPDLAKKEGVKKSEDHTDTINELGRMEWTNKEWKKDGAEYALGTMASEKMLDGLILAAQARKNPSFQIKNQPQDVKDKFVKDVYAELTSHVKRFNPELGNDLFAWINSQLGNKALNVQKRPEYSGDKLTKASDITATTEEGAPVFQIEADTDIETSYIDRIGLKEEQKEQYSELRHLLGLDENMMNTVRQAVVKTFGTELPDVRARNITTSKKGKIKINYKNNTVSVIDKGKEVFSKKLKKHEIDGLLVKDGDTVKKGQLLTQGFREALQQSFRTELKKPIQDMMGGRTDYDLFLTEQFPLIFDILPLETLVQMERNVDPENRIFVKEVEKNIKPTRVDDLIGDGILPKDTPRTSGPSLWKKQKYPGDAKVMAFFRGTNMKNVLGYEVVSSTFGTRKDKLAMEIGVELAFDATSETIQSVEVQEKRKAILELRGKEQLENEKAIIGKQINRNPSIKFSTEGRTSSLPKNYTTELFNQHFDQLVNDAKQEGVDQLIDNKGKLIKDYPVNIPQFTVDVVASIFNSGTVDTDVEIKFKRDFFGDPDIPQNIKDEYKESGVLNRKNTKALDEMHNANKEIFKLLGPDIISALDALGTIEFFGYHYRYLDAGKTKKGKPGEKGMYSDALTDLINSLVDPKVSIESGIVPKDLNPMNVKLGKSIFHDVMRIWNMKIPAAEKREMYLDKLRDKTDGANVSNKILAKHIAKTLITAVRNKTISNTAFLNLLQAQTSLAGGFRAYTDLAMIDFRDGSQALYVSKNGKFTNNKNVLNTGGRVNVNHPQFKEVKKEFPNKTDREIINELRPKGEHLKPNGNTMLEIAKLAYDLNADIDSRLNEIFEDHSQLLTSFFVTNKIDTEYGKNSTLGYNRINAVPNDAKYFIGPNGESSSTILENKAYEKGLNKFSDKAVVKSNKIKNAQKAADVKASTEATGASVFDFDETLIIDGKNFVVATNPKTGKVIKISSGNWPIQGPKLAKQGYEFNFDDFVNVRGGVKGPLFQKLLNRIKKYGPENNFVLTARPQESAIAIHGWLKSKGVDIPLKNITGLANSTSQAKAQWIIDKFAEGYNDMYFVDDALPNVEAVKEVLDQLDIKGSSVQAKIQFSNNASDTFNDMLERVYGIERQKEFSAQEARQRGKDKGRNIFENLWIPPSAEDFKGLLYHFLDKGKKGDADLLFFRDNLLKPYAEGIRDWNAYKQNMADDYANLKKKFPDIVKRLNETVAGTNFTLDSAIRVYLWNKNGIEIPGLAKATKIKLINHVKGDINAMSFADILSSITKVKEGYIAPKEYWSVETIASDLANTVNKVGRNNFLQKWIENKNIIFSEENLNKIEVIKGRGFRDALENMLHRMETGSNRLQGTDKNVNKFLDWVNGSVGATMFWNIRSAALQTISTVNFINWEDNNIFKASTAFANQKQFWKDFAFIFNSPMLKQRRAGLAIDVSASELTKAFADGRNKPQAIMAYLLEKGFTPTRVADSFAISMGGATFYRNRFNKYKKQGMSEVEAKKQAWLDFQEIAEETQQSSRPDLISMQQAGTLGRILLAWQNTPMQMTRLTKKALSDIVNGRGSMKANVSRIIYYGLAQNLIFGALQTGLMFMMFGSDEDEEKKKTQELRVANGALDTLLRGTGIYGAAIATLKNVILEWQRQENKAYGKRDDSKILLEAVSFSPPVGSKLRKINNAIKTQTFNKGVGKKLGVRIENPGLNKWANIIEGVTNFPLARLINKANNVEEALTGNHEMWQRVALLAGWSQWTVGVEDEELVEAKKQAKEERKEKKRLEKEKQKAEKKKAEEERKKKEGIKTVQCSGIRSNGQRCGLTTETKAKTWKCPHHMEFKDGMDRDGDGLKEYRCTAIKTNGKRCNNKTENKNKKCYAHQ